MTDNRLVSALIVSPPAILLLWFAARDFGQPFVSLFVVACGAWGFVAGYVAHGDGR